MSGDSLEEWSEPGKQAAPWWHLGTWRGVFGCYTTWRLVLQDGTVCLKAERLYVTQSTSESRTRKHCPNKIRHWHVRWEKWFGPNQFPVSPRQSGSF